MASKIIGGVLNFRVDGRIISTNGQVKIDSMGGEQLESVPQVSGDVHYKRMVKAAELSATITTTPGLDIRSLKDSRFVGVSLQAASGHTYVLRDATQVGDGAIDVEGGTLELKFSGSKVEIL